MRFMRAEPLGMSVAGAGSQTHQQLSDVSSVVVGSFEVGIVLLFCAQIASVTARSYTIIRISWYFIPVYVFPDKTPLSVLQKPEGKTNHAVEGCKSVKSDGGQVQQLSINVPPRCKMLSQGCIRVTVPRETWNISSYLLGPGKASAGVLFSWSHCASRVMQKYGRELRWGKQGDRRYTSHGTG